MRHINAFPDFTLQERADLRAKILVGIVQQVTPDMSHWAEAYTADQRWTLYRCWVPASKWTDGKGYKKLKFKGHTLYTHRAAYEVIGSSNPNSPNYEGTAVPEGYILDHLCRNHSCCQPEHLEPVPPKVNIERGANPNHLMRNGAPPPVDPRPPLIFGAGDPPTADEYDNYRDPTPAERAAADRRPHLRKDAPPPVRVEYLTGEVDFNSLGRAAVVVPADPLPAHLHNCQTIHAAALVETFDKPLTIQKQPQDPVAVDFRPYPKKIPEHLRDGEGAASLNAARAEVRRREREPGRRWILRPHPTIKNAWEEVLEPYPWWRQTWWWRFGTWMKERLAP